MTTPEAMLTFPAPPPPERPRRRRLLAVIAVLWAVALFGSGVWYSFHGAPTVRDQTTIVQAQPRVDGAIGKVVTAAGTDVVPAVSGYEKTDDCDVTPVRSGARYARAARFYTSVGAEQQLLARIAAGLPPSYHAKVSAHELTADAGYYVALDGAVEQPGVVVVLANTGCRPLGHQPAADPSAEPPAADRVAIDPVLTALGDGPVQWRVHQLPCGVRTVEATTGVGPSRTAPPVPGTAVLNRDGLLAYRDGGIAVAVRRTDSALTVTATTGSCQ